MKSPNAARVFPSAGHLSLSPMSRSGHLCLSPMSRCGKGVNVGFTRYDVPLHREPGGMVTVAGTRFERTIMSEELRSIPPQHGSFVFTSESVTEGHPDKIAFLPFRLH